MRPNIQLVCGRDKHFPQVILIGRSVDGGAAKRGAEEVMRRVVCCCNWYACSRECDAPSVEGFSWSEKDSPMYFF
jgi:hypothetical protein